ncbi:hypothetical protein WDW86_11825 [Bdellovibrionota bacterium FG-2]
MRRRFWLIAILALFNALVVLWPITDSGYSFDDHILSTVRGAMREHNTGLLGIMAVGIRALFAGQGRFLPLSAVSATVPMYFLGRFAYKLGSILLIVLDIAVFASLVRRVSGSLRLALLFLVLAPCFFQIRIGPDPILGYHWLMQGVLLLTALSLCFYWDYLQRNSRRLWLLSLSLAVIGLFSYEMTYTFFLMPMALWVIHRKQTGEGIKVRELLWAGMPFFCATLVAASTVLLLRLAGGLHWVGNNGAYIPLFDINRVFVSMLRHVSAVVPLSFVSLAGVREDFHFPLNEFFRLLWNQLGWLDVGLFISEAAVVGYVVHSVRDSRRSINPLGILVLGLLFVFLPVALIVFSPKYQASTWIGWGYSYLPVLLSFFGAITLAALGCWRLMSMARIHSYPMLRYSLIVLIALVTAAIAVISHGTIGVLVSSDQVLNVERENLEAALRAGIFGEVRGEVRNDAYLVTDNIAEIHRNTSLFRQFADLRLRKVTGPGNLLGGPIASDYSAPVFSPVNLITLPLPSDALRGQTAERMTYEFGPEHRVFYLSFVPSPNYSAVVLGTLRNFVTTNAQIFEATSESVVLFVRDSTAPLRVLYDVMPDNGVGKRESVVIELGSLTQIFQTDRGRVVRIASASVPAVPGVLGLPGIPGILAAPRQLIDLRSVKVSF